MMEEKEDMRGHHHPKVAGFSWVVEGVVAGSAAPGSHPARLRDDLEELARAGVTAIVSLNEAHPPLQPEADLRAALHHHDDDDDEDDDEGGGPLLRLHLHLPVPDYRSPTLDQMQQFVEVVETQLEKGGATLVHCNAGMGRTGTMLAAYLIASQGMPAREAITTMRKLRPGSVQTFKQEDGLVEFAKLMEEKKRKNPNT